MKWKLLSFIQLIKNPSHKDLWGLKVQYFQFIQLKKTPSNSTNEITLVK